MEGKFMRKVLMFAVAMFALVITSGCGGCGCHNECDSGCGGSVRVAPAVVVPAK
jgi:hypothetical protein